MLKRLWNSLLGGSIKPPSPPLNAAQQPSKRVDVARAKPTLSAGVMNNNIDPVDHLRTLQALSGGHKPLSVEEALRLAKCAKAKVYDVRSPSEYMDDCIPGSENVPVLDDAERKTVGTLYKAVSKVQARQVGAALIAKHIAQHLDTRFTPTSAEQSELKIMYCARGNLRSQSLAAILNLIGYQARTIEGGYKSYRNYVQKSLNELPAKYDFNVVTGLTGTRKTWTLQRLANEYKEQVLDLEAFANHRGSVLGGFEHEQPSQRTFESRIVQCLETFTPSRPIWIESESRKIGNLLVPVALWERAILSPSKVYELVSPVDDRVEFLLSQYQAWNINKEQLRELLWSLKKIAGDQRVRTWCQFLDQGDLRSLTKSLILEHYDVRYKQSKVSNALEAKASKTSDLIHDLYGGQKEAK